MDINVQVVHRIDGLEGLESGYFIRRKVVHRIDGLEDTKKRLKKLVIVVHRIDGLEVLLPMQHQHL